MDEVIDPVYPGHLSEEAVSVRIRTEILEGVETLAISPNHHSAQSLDRLLSMNSQR